MDINLVLALFAGGLVLFSPFSATLQRWSLPGPLVALVFGFLIGPYALNVLSIDSFGIDSNTLLEQACRLTLAVGLAGVALRLPHGYWRANIRWPAVMIPLGMVVMFLVASGILGALLGLPLLMALLIGAILTPTDPIVSTPIVTGPQAKQYIPNRVRYNISAESGINDGVGYLLVFLPILLLTDPVRAWSELFTTVLLWEIFVAVVIGVVAGWVLGKIYYIARNRGWAEETSYLGFIVPASLLVLGGGKLLGTDAVLAVFVFGAVFGHMIPPQQEEDENKIDDVVNRFFILPVFMLLGLALPVDEWIRLGFVALLVVIATVLLRRIVTVWLLSPLFRKLHNRSEIAFLSWFGPIGISALFYATLATRYTGESVILPLVTLAITVSVLIHGLTAIPMSKWLARRETQRQHKSG